MDWWWALLLIFGGLMLLIATGLPIAFGFLGIILVGTFLFWGGQKQVMLLSLTMFSTLASYTLLPVAMFILMGEVIFESGIGFTVIDALDKWVGRMRARLSLLAVASGAGLAALSGTAMGTVGLLGSALVPEMERRGYKKPMTLGPVLGSCGLAMMIPPSAIGVILAYIAQISVAKVLIGGIIPGLMMAILYAGYIIIRCRLQPSLAPAYEAPPTPLSDKVRSFIRDILPFGFIVFMVTGTILMGIATPSEASATGALGCFILAAAYRKLSWGVLERILWGTIRIVGMVLLIIMASVAFGQMLAFSGASRGLINLAMGAPVTPVVLVIAMFIILIFLGMFMDDLAIIMITVPIFFPIILAFGYNPVWFAILMLLSLEMASTTPPYGVVLFVMKGVAPPDTTMGDIYKSAIPFLLCDVVAVALMIAFPIIPVWLGDLMLG